MTGWNPGITSHPSLMTTEALQSERWIQLGVKRSLSVQVPRFLNARYYLNSTDGGYINQGSLAEQNV